MRSPEFEDNQSGPAAASSVSVEDNAASFAVGDG